MSAGGREGSAARHKLETWWCGFRHGHRTNAENISVKCGKRADGLVSFHCARCQKEVYTKALDDCDAEVVRIVQALHGMEPLDFDELEYE